MPGFRAVAWDIDGTLVDSEALHHRALVAISKASGADISDLPDDAFRGIHMLDVWEALRPRFPTSLKRGAWIAAIERHYVERAHEAAPSPGAIEAIRTLAARGVAQACANLVALGIRDEIAFSISLDDVSAGKPDPEPFLEAARRFALPPRDVVAVEDSAAGAASARKAGLYVVNYAPGGQTIIACDKRIARLIDVAAMFEV